jgi:hypothetical protein
VIVAGAVRFLLLAEDGVPGEHADLSENSK